MSIRTLVAMFVLSGVPMVLALGCGPSSMQCQRSSEPLEAERCIQTGSPAEAAGTAAAATVAWGAVGCRVNGCNLPYTCNEESGYCERMRCGEGLSCPTSYECDMRRGLCY